MIKKVEGWQMRRTPEELYKGYREKREATEEGVVGVDAVSEERIGGLRRGLAEELGIESEVSEVGEMYSGYQRERIGGRDQVVDSIVGEWMQERSCDEVMKAIESSLSTDTEGRVAGESVERESVSGGVARGLFSLPGKLFDGVLEKISRPVRYGVPVATLALLAVVVVPTVLQQSTRDKEIRQLAEVSGVPASLLSVAEKVWSGIEVGDAGALGFSTVRSEESRYLGLGIRSTDVAVTLAAGELDQKDGILLDLMQYAQELEAGEVKDGVEDLLSGLSLGEVDRKSVAVSLGALEEAVLGAGETEAEWYRLGRRLETLQLSTDYAREEGEWEGLSEAMSGMGEVDEVKLQAVPDVRLSELLRELEMLDDEEFPTTQDLRTIDSVISRIRVLVD